MTCRELDDRIEALASGEQFEDADFTAHLSNCPHCQAQLALARRIEGTLERPALSEVPQGFAARVERRLRRDWWKAEQVIDVTFNLAIAGGLGAVAIGVWVLLSVSGLTVVTTDASSVFMSGLKDAVDSLAPRLSTYTLAFLLIMTAMVVWWWVDNEETG